MTGRHIGRGGELDASSECAFFAHSFADPTCAKIAPVEAGELIREASTEKSSVDQWAGLCPLLHALSTVLSCRTEPALDLIQGFGISGIVHEILTTSCQLPGVSGMTAMHELFPSYELPATSYGWEVA